MIKTARSHCGVHLAIKRSVEITGIGDSQCSKQALCSHAYIHSDSVIKKVSYENFET